MEKQYICRFNPDKQEILVENGKVFIAAKKQTFADWLRTVSSFFKQDNDVAFATLGRSVWAFDTAGHSACAKCSPHDIFHTVTGKAVAYARLRNIPLHPDLMPELSVKTAPKGTKVRENKKGTCSGWTGYIYERYNPATNAVGIVCVAPKRWGDVKPGNSFTLFFMDPKYLDIIEEE